ncbi:transcriptional regulator [Deinococcus detaillensis]|uniref:Transcriptional regulator n=1 Tax=Deinococcus detaillensis TaxID=2592048 RepID=A0A553ULT7_9DEIO|nr:metalloregulator ArsR/SmtB family transcription factor [Deinococcus detaillensis]TSA81152.1 transcriptional regulator [Deinococcus detaillensis]
MTVVAAIPAASLPERTPERTKDKLLEAVKECDCATAQTLADKLGLSVPAIRRHLQDLQDAGHLDVRSEKPGGRGRPQHVYVLTEAGEATFPKAYASLCVDVLRHVDTLFGEGAVMRVLDARQLDLYELLAPLLSQHGDLGSKLEALTEALCQHGYAARAYQERGQWYLSQRNCPAPAVAKAFPELCQTELSLYRELLGVPISRESRLSCGAAECRYKVG